MAIKGKKSSADKAEQEGKEAHYFKLGQSGNPAGRPKGSRNKYSEAFLSDFLADWEVAGASAIQMCRLADPAAYLRVAASLIPKEFNLKDEDSTLERILERLGTEELEQLITGITALGAVKNKN